MSKRRRLSSTANSAIDAASTLAPWLAPVPVSLPHAAPGKPTEAQHHDHTFSVESPTHGVVFEDRQQRQRQQHARSFAASHPRGGAPKELRATSESEQKPRQGQVPSRAAAPSRRIKGKTPPQEVNNITVENFNRVISTQIQYVPQPHETLAGRDPCLAETKTPSIGKCISTCSSQAGDARESTMPAVRAANADDAGTVEAPDTLTLMVTEELQIQKEATWSPSALGEVPAGCGQENSSNSKADNAMLPQLDNSKTLAKPAFTKARTDDQKSKPPSKTAEESVAGCGYSRLEPKHPNDADHAANSLNQIDVAGVLYMPAVKAVAEPARAQKGSTSSSKRLATKLASSSGLNEAFQGRAHVAAVGKSSLNHLREVVGIGSGINTQDCFSNSHIEMAKRSEDNESNISRVARDVVAEEPTAEMDLHRAAKARRSRQQVPVTPTSVATGIICEQPVVEAISDSSASSNMLVAQGVVAEEPDATGGTLHVASSASSSGRAQNQIPCALLPRRGALRKPILGTNKTDVVEQEDAAEAIRADETAHVNENLVVTGPTPPAEMDSRHAEPVEHEKLENQSTDTKEQMAADVGGTNLADAGRAEANTRPSQIRRQAEARDEALKLGMQLCREGVNEAPQFRQLRQPHPERGEIGTPLDTPAPTVEETVGQNVADLSQHEILEDGYEVAAGVVDLFPDELSLNCEGGPSINGVDCAQPGSPEFDSRPLPENKMHVALNVDEDIEQDSKICDGEESIWLDPAIADSDDGENSKWLDPPTPDSDGYIDEVEDHSDKEPDDVSNVPAADGVDDRVGCPSVRHVVDQQVGHARTVGREIPLRPFNHDEHWAEIGKADEALPQRVLVCGDVEDRLDLLHQLIDSFNECGQPVDFVLAVGRFITEGKKDIIEQYIGVDGNMPEKTMPAPVYFIDQSATFISKSEQQNKSFIPWGPNLTFLGGCGVENIRGLKIAFLSGRYDEDAYGTVWGIRHFVGQSYTRNAIQHVLDLAQAHEAIDVLLTSEWPDLFWSTAYKREAPTPVKKWHSSPIVSELFFSLKPRYHICADAGTYSYRKADQGHYGFICSSVALAKTSASAEGRTEKNKRWFHVLKFNVDQPLPIASKTVLKTSFSIPRPQSELTNPTRTAEDPTLQYLLRKHPRVKDDRTSTGAAPSKVGTSPPNVDDDGVKPLASLPPGWTVCYSRTCGMPYYFHEATGHTQWDQPGHDEDHSFVKS